MPSARSRRVFLLCTLFVSTLRAQGAAPTVPAQLAGVEGGSATNVPFGSNQACRFQCIYDASVLPWSGPMLFTGISIRAERPTSRLSKRTT